MGAALRKVGADGERREQLIEATIASIASDGFAATTLMRIANRAGVSPGLVAHYFGDKEGLLEATLRHLAGRLARAAAERLRGTRTPRERIAALVEAVLSDAEFDRRTATVWLAFWAEVPHSSRSGRVQRAYARRLRSNLVHAYRGLVSRPEAERLAEATAAFIDGLWLSATLADGAPAAARARRLALGFVDGQLALLRLALLDREA